MHIRGQSRDQATLFPEQLDDLTTSPVTCAYRQRRQRRRHKVQGTTLAEAHHPNGLWCADYKGEFMLGNKQSIGNAFFASASTRSTFVSFLPLFAFAMSFAPSAFR
jgi:hypothetical protein